jgi:predicted acylesterase/phospholipase RssA/proteasome lid subunit RPN8/RPN11
MYGFIGRLDAWVRDGAQNRLDPDDAPLHPPVAYTGSNRLIVPVADAPLAIDAPWIGLAVLSQRGLRDEIVDWLALDAPRPPAFAPAILLHRPLPFEFPETISSLTDEFERQGVSYAPFVWLLARLALDTRAGTPLLVVIGTPMRRVDAGGPRLPHLAAWEISSEDSDQLRLLNALEIDEARFQAFGAEAKRKVVEWSISAKIRWCHVRESRPAVTRRRDAGAATSWFAGRTVELWGCGAIGSHIAESLARAGVRGVVLRDQGLVTPGLLARQAFDDSDIGRRKVDALSDRLLRLAPSLQIDTSAMDLLDHLDTPDPMGAADLIIESTAAAPLRLKLERVLRSNPRRPPIVSLGVNSDATAAMVALAGPSYPGGPVDIERRLKLEACRRPELAPLLDSFWPLAPANHRFQPEPGCSEPTFVGSDTDLAGLSARMLNAVASDLVLHSDSSAIGWLFNFHGTLHRFPFPPDFILGRSADRYEIRVSGLALREIRGWAQRSRRLAGPATETGGLLFGELNEAAGVIWVSEAEGPPPDSTGSTEHFVCGVQGMGETANEKSLRFRDSVACLGSWHTHPQSAPTPSDTDLVGVAQILADASTHRRVCLVLVLGGEPPNLLLGAHAFRVISRDQVELSAGWVTSDVRQLPLDVPRPRNLGVALSGGGSRAIAFHLGCFRALHDLQLLDRVQVLSCVSGGSVFGALWAYSTDDFHEFEARVRALLRRGLACDILRESLRPYSLFRMTTDLVAAGAGSLLRGVARALLGSRLSGLAPFRRRYSRTEAFRDVLERLYFGDRRLADVRRGACDTVINATELRTASAFRFGSRESGCWRFGTIPSDSALVADAVAASAAYPILLPALDREFRFSRRSDDSGTIHRVILTDGGVFENLGTSCMEPGRHEAFSTNVFEPDFIVCCDAGAGLFGDDSFPLRWPARMARSFLTTFRKVQDGTRKRLHQLQATGSLRGFVLAYLGQNDGSLPWMPADLPPREDVSSYPTDFSSMGDSDLERLALRGERLTRLLVAHYLPDL